MFKPARWRSEKNKIKAVFKLQFHATQLAQLGTDALTISVIPADVGKPTARLEKAKAKDGTCYWEKPHYETVKFTQDQKTGKFHEKIYRFVVATGSSMFGVVGEVSLDFASYAEATKLSSLSLPLKNAKSATVLHVSIQRVQDQREVDGSENGNGEDRSFKAQFNNGDIEGSIRSDPTEDHTTSSDITRDRRTSSGSDITLSCSDSSSGLDTPQEPEPKNTKPADESTTTIYEEQQNQRSSQWDWLDGSPQELTTDDSSTSPDAVIKMLKDEIVILARQVDVSELELQTLRKQIVKESKKGNDLSREVATLKEERNAFKEEFDKMKSSQKHGEELKVNDPWTVLDELKQELKHEKDLNSNLRLQLQKTQESNTELILAVRDLDEMLEKKSTVVNSKPDTDDDDQMALEEIVREHSGTKDTYIQEQKIIDLYNEIELYKRDKDDLEMQMEQIALDYEILKQENHEMSYKLEQSQIQEQLKMQYECSSSYATVNELETQIESLDNELKIKSKELSDSILAIKELEEDLENQALGFEADIEEIMHAKVEQEQRAIRAEENLRKVKLQNANTAGKLQEEFRRLSTEMGSAFEEHEKAAMKAMDEANLLRVEKRYLEEMVKKMQDDLRYLEDQYEKKVVDLEDQIALKLKQVDEMEKQIEDQRSCCKNEIEKLKSENQNLENELKNKDNEVERLKSRCNEMKLFVKEYESDKENFKKQVSQLKSEIKKKDEAFISLEKKLKDSNNRIIALEGSKTNPRNNKSVPVLRSVKEVANMKDRMRLLQDQIKLKETALEQSEASFLEKEKELQHKIEELETRLEVLDQNTEDPQEFEVEHSNPAIKSDNEQIFEAPSNEMALLKNRSKSMEVELKEMQERYSEISLKFAEVEGERQQLVMTLRNLKNTKK